MVRSVRKRLVFVLGAIAVAVLGLAGTASAHAELVSTSPPADSVLTTSPTQIVLTFDEAVDTVPGSIRVVAGDGTEVQLGAVNQSLGSDTLVADLPTLANGSYIVAWRAISADSHPVSGAFTFSVGSKSTTQPGLVDSLLTGGQPSRPAEVWQGVGRAASFLGVGVLVGGYAITVLLAPALLRGRRVGLLLYGAGIVGIAGTALMIAAQASVATGSWFAWDSVTSTRAGRWWIVRLVLVAAGLAFVAVRKHYRAHTGWPALGLAGGMFLLGVVAAGGHAVTGRWIPLGFAATLVHLGAMSLWVGGLGVTAAAVARHDLWRFGARFSPVAFGSVVALALSGVVNAWRQTSSWSALVNSTYGAWLIAKLVILAAVITIAAVSRWIVRLPSEAGVLQTASVGAAAAEVPAAEHDGMLRRTVLAEAFAIVLVFGATAGLVNSAPPRSAAVGGIGSVTAVQNSRIAQLTLDPATTGGTTMHVYLSSATGALEQPTSIAVTATLASRQIGPLLIPTTPSGPGHVTSTNANLPLAGTWTFTITAKYSEFDETIFTVELDVK